MESLATLEATNVLLATPRFEGAGEQACGRLLGGGDDGAIVGVTFTRSADQWLDDYSDRLGTLPPAVWLLPVGERARSATADGVNVRTVPSTSGEPPGTDTEVHVRPVEHPGNLTSLGVALTECLPEAAAHGSSPARLCFGSVTTLRQHVEARSIFQFFQVLSNHVAAHEVRAHYHVDPTAMAEQDVNRLKVLFDAVVEVDEEGDCTVRQRD